MSENNKQISSENDNLFGMNSKQIQKDLLYFKDDLLKEMRQIDTKLINKYTLTDSLVSKKIEEFECRIQVCISKVAELSNLIVTDKTIREKVENLIKFKEKTDETIMTHDIQLNNLYKDSHNSIDRIDQILNDSVLYPGIIGNLSRFKNFHELIDFVLTSISDLTSFRDKNTLDLKDYKSKLEQTIQSFKLQINNFLTSANQFATTSVNASEDRIKNILKIYDDRLQDSRVENAHYSVKMEREFEALKKDWDKILKIKQEINDNLNKAEKSMRDDTAKIADMFVNYKQEFKLIKARFIQLSEFLKDVRFRINLQNELKKKQYIEMGNLMDFRQKQKLDENGSYMENFNQPITDFSSSKKISRQNTTSFEKRPLKFNPEKSYIKQYINGELTAKDLNNIRELKENIFSIKEKEDDNIDRDIQIVEEFKNKRRSSLKKPSLIHMDGFSKKKSMHRLTTFNLGPQDSFSKTFTRSNKGNFGHKSKNTNNIEFDLSSLYELFDFDFDKKPVNHNFNSRNSMQIKTTSKFLETSKDFSMKKTPRNDKSYDRLDRYIDNQKSYDLRKSDKKSNKNTSYDKNSENIKEIKKENSILRSSSRKISKKIDEVENEEAREKEEKDIEKRMRNLSIKKIDDELVKVEEENENENKNENKNEDIKQDKPKIDEYTNKMPIQKEEKDISKIRQFIPTVLTPIPSVSIAKPNKTNVDQMIENKNKHEPMNIKPPVINQLKPINFSEFNKTDNNFFHKKKTRFDHTIEAVENLFNPSSTKTNKNSAKNIIRETNAKINLINLKLPSLNENNNQKPNNFMSNPNSAKNTQAILQFNYNGPNVGIKHKIIKEPGNIEAYGKIINDSLHVINLKQKDKKFGIDLDHSRTKKPLTGIIYKDESEDKTKRGLSSKYKININTNTNNKINNNVKNKLNNNNNMTSKSGVNINSVGKNKTIKNNGNRTEEAIQIQKVFNNLKGYLDNI